MAIPGAVLSRWAHHRSAKASIQAHTAIRDALASYNWPKGMKFDVFLQGSYKNHTNLRGDSDVDVVIQLQDRIKPNLAALRGKKLTTNKSHQVALQRWQSFRTHALQATRAKFSDSVQSGRKTLKISKGKIPASADLVVTLIHSDGLAFYLPDERRWVVSYPQLHHGRGNRKERSTGNRFKRTIRMFKVARHELLRRKMIAEDTTSSYFIECLLYNVPDQYFRKTLMKTYEDIVVWLSSAKLRGFTSQNGKVKLFGGQPEQWDAAKARGFVRALANLWNTWQ